MDKNSLNLLQSSKNLFSFNSLADKFNYKGLEFLKKDDYENAITCFFQSLDYDQNYSHAYSNIGNALLKKVILMKLSKCLRMQLN